MVGRGCVKILLQCAFVWNSKYVRSGVELSVVEWCDEEGHVRELKFGALVNVVQRCRQLQ
jgi:hypothetical protein